MIKRPAKVNCGEFYAIPLFLQKHSELERFKKSDFLGNDKRFCYCRIINDSGINIIIEAFNLVGGMVSDINDIIQSGRLFSPVQITGLGIYKKRWQKIGQQNNYDKEKNSQFSQIQFVFPPLPGMPRLWQNGVEKEISFEESRNHESSKSWNAVHLEERIIETLKEKGIDV